MHIKDRQNRISVQKLEEVSEFGKAERKTVAFQKRDMLNREFIEKMVQYIENNYSNSSLNVSIVGNEFNTASPYLSKMFKEYREGGHDGFTGVE